MKDTVTVVIPVRNGEHFLRGAILSALHQTHPPAEVIVIDDNSSDDTRSVAEGFGDDVLLLTGSGAGAGPARNLGVAHSSSKFIAFLDADDLWLPTKLESQIPLAGEGYIVGTYAEYVVGSREKRVGTSIRSESDAQATDWIREGQALPALLSTWLVERSTFLRLGGFDPRFRVAQDFELAARWCREGVEFRVVRNVLTTYRLHASSGTYQKYREQFLRATYVGQQVDCEQLPLEKFLREPPKEIERHARAGFNFRHALIEFGEGRLLTAFGYFTISCLTDPRRFLAKLKRQSPLRG